MNSRELMKATMRREPAERIPTMPQICYDLPVRINAKENGIGWQEGYRLCAENPGAVYDYVIEIAKRIGCDGLRLFISSDARKVVIKDGQLIVIDPKTNDRIGRIDTHGGGELILDNPPPIVNSFKEAKDRLNAMVDEVTDEKVEILKANRERIPELFVASSPGGITMNTYNDLRGREQAMIDFYERPDFVSAVIDMQAETVIRIAEKLIKADIDAFYIGDPSASASLISPKHFEQFCLPAYQKFCNHFKNTDILIYIHICGNANPILEMMAETGADVIEPLDPLGGVKVDDAKSRVGRKAALMGGVNTLTLSDGSVDDVIKESILKCRQGGPYGYILASGDMVPPDTPIENIKALVDVAVKSLWK